MKRLACEMCGSTDLIKQDGVFVCQSCGCKYSVEEAKKMMIEGTVDVSGSTVKVDTSDELANLYQIARRARDDNNSENAARYYDMILVKDPSSWEAAFYVVYFKALNCKIAYIQSAAISVSNCEESVLKLIRDHVPESEQQAAVSEVTLRSCYIANMLAKGAKSHYDGIDKDIRSKYTQEFVNNMCAARDILYTCGSHIETIFGDRDGFLIYAAKAWENGVEIHTSIMPYFSNRQANEQQRNLYVQKAEKYDTKYSEQMERKQRQNQLQQDIRFLERKISYINPEAYDGVLVNLPFYIFWVIGVIGIILSFDSLNYDDYHSMFMLILTGLALIAIAVIFFSPSKRKKKENELLIATKKELEEKRAELAELNKKKN